MTSYQRLKQHIAYLEQRGRELERILAHVDRQLGERHIKVKPLLMGLRGDEFLTDVNSGSLHLPNIGMW